jgi:flotillin
VLNNLNDISPQVAIGIGVALLVLLLIFIQWVKTLLQICAPNEVLIFSGGRRRRMSDGSYRNYVVLFGGRRFRIPIFEKVQRMSLNVMEVPINIRGAYSKGGIPLNVDAIANVKISSDPIAVGNAIERFLNRDTSEIRRVAKETLEGHLRGVLARLTPEQVNEDRLKFAEELSNESELDLNKLGIHLDTLKIQHVSDDVRYLDSIGRSEIASVIRAAEIAESDARRDAEQAEAENQARANVSQATADTNIAKMKNELRTIQANLEAEVRAEEEKTIAAAKQARAEAEKELQAIRAELEGLRLQVEKILPAEADFVAQQHRANGEAAIVRERGLAVSESVNKMNEAWAAAGDSAVSIMLMDDIEKLLETAAKGVSKVKVKNLNMIDGGDGNTLSGYVSAYPAMLKSIFEAVAQTTGIDVQKSISAAVSETPNQSDSQQEDK